MTCNHICKNCKYFLDTSTHALFGMSTNYHCTFNSTKEKDCVTGEEVTKYQYCKIKNKDGCCKDFEPLVSTTISGELEELKKEFSGNGVYDSSFVTSVISALIEILAGNCDAREIIVKLIDARNNDNTYLYDADIDSYEYLITQEFKKILRGELTKKHFKEK